MSGMGSRQDGRPEPDLGAARTPMAALRRTGASQLGLAAGLGLALAPGAAAATSGPTILPVPGLRVEIGAHWLVPQPTVSAPPQPTDPLLIPDRGAHLSLSLQLQTAVLFFPKATDVKAWGLFPELGYHYQRRDLGTTALFNAGLGLGYMPSPFVYVAYMPRFVLGRVYGADAEGNASPELYRTAVGIRHGALIGLLLGTLHVELSHQLLFLEGREQHELVALCGVDVLRLALAGAALAFRR